MQAQVNNMSSFIKQIAHVEKKPISIEREEGDVIVIEGVRYDADYFRTFGTPETDVLYSVQKIDDGCVKLTVISSVEEARIFFEEIINA